MTHPYPMLFSPVTINRLKVRNRIAYPALGLVYSYDRKLNDRYIEFYAARARGGTGIVTVGPVGIGCRGSGIGFLSLEDDSHIPSLQALTARIREHGAASWIQLFHAGAYAHPFLMDGQQPMAPSAVFSRYSKTTPDAMTLEDIEAVKSAFAASALRARQAGFDGVEIIGSAGYLVTQFLSPKTNQRTDAYGGSFENRLRFPLELIQAVRIAVGSDCPLTIRMAGNDFVAGSNTSAETPLIAQAYESAGIDAINVTGGWHETRVPQLPSVVPGSGLAYLARLIREKVSVPVMASNRISTPEAAESILRNGCADLVNLGRVLLADPDWPIKAMEDRADEIRPCVACSQGCTDEVFSGRPVFCIGNPRTGFERERKLVPAAEPRRVMVIGAGPAGLEAAVTAARMGHEVDLYEKTGQIGGQIPLAAAPPHKHEFLEFVRYYRAMLKKHPVRLHLSTPVDMDQILKAGPDHVILATGASPVALPIPGIGAPEVVSAWDLLRQDQYLGREVAVIGGGAVGLETALFVAAKGTLDPEGLHFLFAYEAEPVEKLRELMFRGSSRVTVFEMLDAVGRDVGKSTRWVLMDTLSRHGVVLKTGVTIDRIESGIIHYRQEGGKASQRFDTIVTAAGSRAVDTLARQLEDADVRFTSVGDCTGPANLGKAIHDGYLAALSLGEEEKR